MLTEEYKYAVAVSYLINTIANNAKLNARSIYEQLDGLIGKPEDASVPKTESPPAETKVIAPKELLKLTAQQIIRRHVGVSTTIYNDRLIDKPVSAIGGGFVWANRRSIKPRKYLSPGQITAIVDDLRKAGYTVEQVVPLFKHPTANSSMVRFRVQRVGG